MVLSPKKCAICQKSFAPTSPNSVYCPSCIKSKKVKKFRIKSQGLGHCEHCGKKIDKLMRWCRNEECQAAKKEYTEKKQAANKARRLRKKREKQRMFREARKVAREQTDKKPRVCARCGKDPYPNIMYCKSCHATITSTYGGLEEVSAEWNYS